MVRGLGDIVTLLVTALPPWALAVLAVVVVVVGGPAWFDSVRIKQVKGCIRRMLRAEAAARPALVDEAFERAGARPRRLVALVREAHKYQFRAMAEEGLRRLEAGGRAPDDVRALRLLLHPPVAAPPNSLEAVVRVEQLMEAELWVGAREQLAIARSKYPGDPELAALQARLDAQLAVPDGSRVE